MTKPFIGKGNGATPVDSPAQSSRFRLLAAKLTGRTARQGGAVIVEQGMTSLTNFLTGVLVARSCSGERYGFYVMAMTLLTTTMAVQYSLVGMPYTTLAPHLRSLRQKVYTGSTLLMQLGVCLLDIVVFLVVAAIMKVTGSGDGLYQVLFTLAGACAFLLVRDFARTFLLADLRVWASLAMGMVVTGLTIVLLVIAYFTHHLGPASAYVFLAAGASPAIVVLYFRRRDIRPMFRYIREDFAENWRLGKWLLAGVALDALAYPLYSWFLAAVHGSSETAVLGACLMPIMVMNPLLQGMPKFVNPKMSHAARQGKGLVVRLAVQFVAVSAVLFTPVVGLIVLFQEQILHFLYADKYRHMGLLMSLLGIMYLINAIDSPVRSGVTAMKQTRTLFWSSMIAGGSSMLVGIPLIYCWGAEGAACGLIASKAASFVFIVFGLAAAGEVQPGSITLRATAGGGSK